MLHASVTSRCRSSSWLSRHRPPARIRRRQAPASSRCDLTSFLTTFPYTASLCRCAVVPYIIRRAATYVGPLYRFGSTAARYLWRPHHCSAHHHTYANSTARYSSRASAHHLHPVPQIPRAKVRALPGPVTPHRLTASSVSIFARTAQNKRAAMLLDWRYCTGFALPGLPLVTTPSSHTCNLQARARCPGSIGHLG